MLQKLNDIISHKNSKILSYYHDGLDEHEIRYKISSLGLSPIRGLIELYKWHNGLSNWNVSTDLTSIFIYGVFAPLDVALKQYQESVELELHSEGYFPILLDDDILINLDDKSADFGALFLRSPALAIIEPMKIFSSMGNFINTHYEYYRGEVFSFDKDGKSIIQFDNLFEVSRRMNPDCKYWE